MRTPFNNRRNNNGNQWGNGNGGSSFGRGLDEELFSFDGGRDEDIRDFTRQMLDTNNSAAVITREGRILPKNHALKAGDKDFTELYKERVWG